MRLTLRTMLAYLDNVLDPVEAEELGRKINESDFASGLVQRIKGVMKKLRMDAPKLDGKGMGNDANSVAEYLDSSLPQDRVGDFERVCLESDKHLAEVAACHQVLTIVLGKPADVPPSLRERIYNLRHPERMPTSAEPPIIVPGRAGASRSRPITKANGQPAAKTAPEVPEYLLSGRRSALWPLIATLAATFLVVAAGLRFMGAFNREHPVLKWFTGTEQVAAVDGAAPAVDSAKPAQPATLPEVAAPDADATSDAEKPASTPTDAAAATSSAAAAPVTTPPTTPPPADLDLPPAKSAPTTEAKTADTALPQPPAPMPPMPPAPSPDAVAATTTTAPTEATAAPPTAPPAAPELIEVGRYTSDDQVIAMLGNDALWHRKPPYSVLAAGERLISLPPYRPQLAFPSGVQVTLVGEGAVKMERPAESGASQVAVDYGRFLVVTAGAAKAQMELDLAGVKGSVTLVDADSSLAVKVGRWLPPGFDPETAPGMPVVELFNLAGRVTWQQDGKEKFEIPPRHVHVYVGVELPETHGPFQPPEWIEVRSVLPVDRTFDRETTIMLEGLIDNSKPLNVSLQELMQHRRIEIRALTARCLASLHEFDPIIRELTDTRQNAYWSGHIETLRHVLYRGKETAAQIRAALERLRGNDSADLYRLLWGYSQDQLDKGGAADLVRFLEDEQMDVRALAFYNLVSITGAHEFYRPERPPSQQTVAIRNWKDRRDKGTMSYKTAPSPIDNYKPPVVVPGTGSGAETRRGTPAPMIAPSGP
jgi:hypothetical protein